VNRLLNSLIIALLLTGALVAQETKLGDFVVTSQLPRLAVENQGRTGTCWCFATTSFLESELQRIHGKAYDLSEMFTVRNTTIEKAKRYVEAGGKAVFGEGGLSHDVIAMIREHGIVPQESYTGLQEGKQRHSHGGMFRKVKGAIKGFVEENGRRFKKKEAEAVAAVVDGHLGAAPTEVTVDGKKMTPQQYATDFLKIPLNDYVEVMSYSYAPFHQKATLTVRDNWMKYDGYLNVPIDEFMKTFDNALEKGYSVAVDIDVSEKTYRPSDGIGTLTDDLEKQGAVTQKVRDAMFKDKRTTDDHLLHIVGVARNEAGKRFYLTKDSWGKNHGKLKGYRMLSENYIRAKVLAFMIHKDALLKRQ